MGNDHFFEADYLGHSGTILVKRLRSISFLLKAYDYPIYLAKNGSFSFSELVNHMAIYDRLKDEIEWNRKIYAELFGYKADAWIIDLNRQKPTQAVVYLWGTEYLYHTLSMQEDSLSQYNLAKIIYREEAGNLYTTFELLSDNVDVSYVKYIVEDVFPNFYYSKVITMSLERDLVC